MGFGNRSPRRALLAAAALVRVGRQHERARVVKRAAPASALHGALVLAFCRRRAGGRGEGSSISKPPGAAKPPPVTTFFWRRFSVRDQSARSQISVAGRKCCCTEQVSSVAEMVARFVEDRRCIAPPSVIGPRCIHRGQTRAKGPLPWADLHPVHTPRTHSLDLAQTMHHLDSCY